MSSSKNFLENSPELTLAPALLVDKNQIILVRYTKLKNFQLKCLDNQACNRYMNSSNVAKALFSGSKNAKLYHCPFITQKKVSTSNALGESKYR